MSRGCKITLIIFLVLGFLGLGACVAAAMWGFGKIRNEDAGQAIVAYTVPAGYDFVTGMDLKGVQFAMYMKGMSTGSPGMMIMLLQDGSGGTSTDEQLEQMALGMRQGVAGGGGGPMAQSSSGGSMKEVARKPVKIGGQDRVMVVEQGTDANGQPTKLGTITFKGAGGPAILMFMAQPETNWSNPDIEAFLTSTNP